MSSIQALGRRDDLGRVVLGEARGHVLLERRVVQQRGLDRRLGLEPADRLDLRFDLRRRRSPGPGWRSARPSTVRPMAANVADGVALAVERPARGAGGSGEQDERRAGTGERGPGRHRRIVARRAGSAAPARWSVAGHPNVPPTDVPFLTLCPLAPESGLRLLSSLEPAKSSTPSLRPEAPIGQAPPVFLLCAGAPTAVGRCSRRGGGESGCVRIETHGTELVRADLHPPQGQGCGRRGRSVPVGRRTDRPRDQRRDRHLQPPRRRAAAQGQGPAVARRRERRSRRASRTRSSSTDPASTRSATSC